MVKYKNDISNSYKLVQIQLFFFASTNNKKMSKQKIIMESELVYIWNESNKHYKNKAIYASNIE